MTYDDRGQGMVHPEAEVRQDVAPLEELIARLGAQNSDIKAMIDRRNKLLREIEDKYRVIGQQFGAVKMSQYEFENESLGIYAESLKSVAVDSQPEYRRG